MSTFLARRGTASKKLVIPFGDRLVRAKSAYSGSSGSRTATFNESEPLPPGYLLIAIVSLSVSTVPTIQSAGWTELPNGGAQSTNQLRMYARQSDGVSNSMQLSSTSTVATIQLLAFYGYTSLTPIFSVGAQKTASTTTQVFADPTELAGQGVLIHAIGQSNTAVNTQVTNGAIQNFDTPAVTTAWPTNGRVASSRFVYVDGAGDLSTTMTFNAARTGYYMSVVMPLL